MSASRPRMRASHSDLLRASGLTLRPVGWRWRRWRSPSRAQAQAQAPAAATPAPPAGDAANAPRKRRQPPPAVIPLDETQAAEQMLHAGNYEAAVAQAKAALNKNERYTPAMLVMAKAYYKLHKYEWTKKLWEMMQANGASDAEKSEIYQLLAFLEVDQKNIPGAIVLFKKAGEARPDNAVIWNNLGAQYLAGQELPGGDAGAGKGGPAAARVRQGPPEPGRRLPRAQGIRKSAGRVPARPTALSQLCRRCVQPRDPLPRCRQDAQPGRSRAHEHRHPVLPALQADDGRHAAGRRSGRRLHRRGAGRHQERGKAPRAPAQERGARAPARREEGGRRRQEGCGRRRSGARRGSPARPARLPARLPAAAPAAPRPETSSLEEAADDHPDHPQP